MKLIQMKVNLTTMERRLIVKIALDYLESIDAIINDTENNTLDIKMICIENGVTKEEYLNRYRLRRAKFLRAVNEPEMIFDFMDEDDFSLIKHFMNKFYTHHKYEEAKRKLWYKFVLLEDYEICYN